MAQLNQPVVIKDEGHFYYGYAGRISFMTNDKVSFVKLLSGLNIEATNDQIQLLDKNAMFPCEQPGKCQCWSCANPCIENTCSECTDGMYRTVECADYVMKADWADK